MNTPKIPILTGRRTTEIELNEINKVYYKLKYQLVGKKSYEKNKHKRKYNKSYMRQWKLDKREKQNADNYYTCVYCGVRLEGRRRKFCSMNHRDYHQHGMIYSGRDKWKVSINIDGVNYDSYREASRILGIHFHTIKYRCLSDNFKNYKKI